MKCLKQSSPTAEILNLYETILATFLSAGHFFHADPALFFNKNRLDGGYSAAVHQF